MSMSFHPCRLPHATWRMRLLFSAFAAHVMHLLLLLANLGTQRVIVNRLACVQGILMSAPRPSHPMVQSVHSKWDLHAEPYGVVVVGAVLAMLTTSNSHACLLFCWLLLLTNSTDADHNPIFFPFATKDGSDNTAALMREEPYDGFPECFGKCFAGQCTMDKTKYGGCCYLSDRKFDDYHR